MSFDLKDYVEVSERIRAWYMEHEGGRITTEIVEHTAERVVVRAEVFRNHIDAAAGVGHSGLAIPGTTPYTKGSELENAETSAVGRALVMAGIPSKNVASANEVRYKRGGAAPSTAEDPAGSRAAATKRESKPAHPAPVGGSSEGEGPAAGATYRECPSCGEVAYSDARLSKGQIAHGFVRCLNSTCEQVYQREGL